MKNRGFLWTLEFLIGMIAITGLFIAAGSYSAHENDSSIPGILCHDLLNVWTYGKNVEIAASELIPTGNYTFSAQPFTDSPTNGIVCHATRIQNGIMEEMFLRIEW